MIGGFAQNLTPDTAPIVYMPVLMSPEDILEAAAAILEKERGSRGRIIEFEENVAAYFGDFLHSWKEFTRGLLKTL